MNWKELLKGIGITFMGVVMLFFGFAFLIIGRNLYGVDASLIFVGGMLSVFAMNGLAEYYINLIKSQTKKVRKR